MTIDSDLRSALASGDPPDATEKVIQHYVDQGVENRVLYEHLLEIFRSLDEQDTEGVEWMSDLMDRLTGWCGSHAEFRPSNETPDPVDVQAYLKEYGRLMENPPEGMTYDEADAHARSVLGGWDALVAKKKRSQSN